MLEQPPRGIWPRDRSVLVAILLWEGEVARAWEEAQAGGCSRDLWRALARERPDDAVGIYRRLLSATIDLRNDNGYDGRSSCWPSCTACWRPSDGRPRTRGSSPRSAKSTAARRTW